jgi:hypothetical protein
VGDDWRRWRIRLPPAAFDEDLPGGRDLRADLLRLGRDTGGGYILMELRVQGAPEAFGGERGREGGRGAAAAVGCASQGPCEQLSCHRAARTHPRPHPSTLHQFPDVADKYPTEPFKLRVVVRGRWGKGEEGPQGECARRPAPPTRARGSSAALLDLHAHRPTAASHPRQQFPRCAPYTGHVTAGGSICIEALTLSGGPGAWQPAYCVESIMQARRGGEGGRGGRARVSPNRVAPRARACTGRPHAVRGGLGPLAAASNGPAPP